MGNTNTTTATTPTRDKRTTIRLPKTNLPPVLEPSNRTQPSAPKVHDRTDGVEFFPLVLGPQFRCTGPDGNPPEPSQAKINTSTPPPAHHRKSTSLGCHRPKVPTPPPDWAHQPTHCRSRPAPDPKCGGSRAAATTTHPHHTHTLPMGICRRRFREQHNEAV